MKIPSDNLEKGFYYHAKHDPEISIYHHAYELIGIGCHTEDDCRPEDANMVIYRPLDENVEIYKAGKFFDLRPLKMWAELMTKNESSVKRFTRITDPAVIEKLEKMRERMYPEQKYI
ncbi:MAG: DUF1653 domain-containing protein [bacterium]